MIGHGELPEKRVCKECVDQVVTPCDVVQIAQLQAQLQATLQLADARRQRERPIGGQSSRAAHYPPLLRPTEVLDSPTSGATEHVAMEKVDGLDADHVFIEGGLSSKLRNHVRATRYEALKAPVQVLIPKPRRPQPRRGGCIGPLCVLMLEKALLELGDGAQ